MVPMNLLNNGSASYVASGYWSKRTYTDAQVFGNIKMAASSESIDYKKVPLYDTWDYATKDSYIHYCLNETIHGVEYFESPNIKDVPIVCDMSSNILSRDIDIDKAEMKALTKQHNKRLSKAEKKLDQLHAKLKKAQKNESFDYAEEADVSHIDYEEDINVLVAEEATLSEGFRDKASVIFEAALKTKVGGEIDRLEGEYAQNLEEEVASVKSDLVEKVDAYLNYVVEGWMQENEVAVEAGLRT